MKPRDLALKTSPTGVTRHSIEAYVERDLGIDGIREAVLYAAGVGGPPAGSDWAPLPRGTLQVRRNSRLSR